jgi:hypothetical protein
MKRISFFVLLTLLSGCASTDVKEYNRGYDHGQLDQIHRDYWAIQNTQKNAQSSKAAPPVHYETVPGPSQVGDIHMVPNQTTIITTQ